MNAAQFDEKVLHKQQECARRGGRRTKRSIGSDAIGEVKRGKLFAVSVSARLLLHGRQVTFDGL